METHPPSGERAALVGLACALGKRVRVALRLCLFPPRQAASPLVFNETAGTLMRVVDEVAFWVIAANSLSRDERWWKDFWYVVAYIWRAGAAALLITSAIA
jgi:hypothetical protein